MKRVHFTFYFDCLELPFEMSVPFSVNSLFSL